MQSYSVIPFSFCSSSGDFSAVDMAYALTNTGGNFEATPEILRSVLPLVNWDYIAAMYLPGRSGAECESRYFSSKRYFSLLAHGAMFISLIAQKFH